MMVDGDLALFGLWPAAAPERKSLARADVGAGTGTDLPALLNDLTTEMREQFDLHRRLRTAAEGWLDVGDGQQDSDGPAAKAARADLKAVTDAMQAIVRTLEKIDALQRQVARDRADAEERAEEMDDAAIRARLDAIIEERAERRARALLEAPGGRDGMSADGSEAA